MTRTQRVAAIAICGVLMISGFAFGRLTKPATTGAESAPPATMPTTETAALSNIAPGQSHSFYLSDYNTGYNEGYESALKGVPNGQATTARTGYNEGYKQGWAEGFQNVQGAETASYLPSNEQVPTRTRYIYRGNTRYVTRTVYSRRHHPSKLRTALTIAAPAALGAGIGGIAGGGKGAGIGALLGGGGGALYHLFKYRD
jgi:hypothetical protein